MPDHMQIDYDKGPTLTPAIKQRLWCWGGALFVSAVFGLLAAVYVTTHVQASVTTGVTNVTEAASDQNCQTIATGRVDGDQFRFAVREELSFIPDLVAATVATHKESKVAKQFVASQIVLLNRALQRERKMVPLPGVPADITSYQELFPLLADQPLVSCKNLGR
jgi:hypothetical protein